MKSRVSPGVVAPTICRPSFRIAANRLHACVLAALSLSASAHDFTEAIDRNVSALENASHIDARSSRSSVDTTPPWLVQNCNDDGVGSLRSVITNVAQSGDTVDLGHLSCSTITLSTEIVINQTDLTLVGPESGSLTISGAGTSRIFHHNSPNIGTLTLQALHIANGSYTNSQWAGGGCIYSRHDVALVRSAVTGCSVVSDSGPAYGGAISGDNVRLIQSIVSSNETMGSSASEGGGIRAKSLTAKYSSISENTAHSSAQIGAEGGGASALQIYLLGSVVVGNIATHSSYYDSQAGGFICSCMGVDVINSTISGNIADQIPGILLYHPSIDPTISNSTIAFNHAIWNGSPGALTFGSPGGGALTLQSSIVADNTAGEANLEEPSDLYILIGSVAGNDNLVVTTNQSPPGFITVSIDPKLGPLQDNGGPTRTHALLPGSPAIGVGNNNAGRVYDQRGTGYRRTTGSTGTTDIGAFEFDTIFAASFETPL